MAAATSRAHSARYLEISRVGWTAFGHSLYKQWFMVPTRLILGTAGVLAALGVTAAVILHTDLFGPSAEEQWAMVDTYCVECHNAAEAAGALVLEGRGPDSVRSSRKSSRPPFASCAAG